MPLFIVAHLRTKSPFVGVEFLRWGDVSSGVCCQLLFATTVAEPTLQKIN